MSFHPPTLPPVHKSNTILFTDCRHAGGVHCCMGRVCEPVACGTQPSYSFCHSHRPANGTYYPVRVVYDVSDIPNCNPRDDITRRCRIISVTSSEAGGDLFAAFPPNAGEWPQVVMLRAKKVPHTQTPRRYTIHSECFDEQMNRAATTRALAAVVQVPPNCRSGDGTCQAAAAALLATQWPSGTSNVWAPTSRSSRLVLSSEP